MTPTIDRERIERTHSLIRPHIRLTPVMELTGADFGLPAFPLTLKLELFQHAGSFKTRGAFANLLTRSIPAAGVVAASGGNHGAAVAYAAMQLGVPVHIFVPTVSSPAKISRIRGYGDFVHYHLLARGSLDVVIESDVNILDIAALTIIVREAGGTFTDLAGREVTLGTTSVLATNGPLHTTVLEALTR